MRIYIVLSFLTSEILVIGDSGTGKSCLIVRFTDDYYADTYISTVGVDFKIKRIEIDGKPQQLQIWDTAGQERFRSITTSYYHSSQGVFVVYDVTNRDSFDHVKFWMDQLDKEAEPNIIRTIIGNKIDDDMKRIVKSSEGQKLAEMYKAGFYEVSAAQNICIKEMFMDMARKVHASVGKPKSTTLAIGKEKGKCCG